MLRRLLDRLTSIASAVLLVALVAVVLGQLEAGITAESAASRDFGQDYLLARAFQDGIDPYVPVRSLASRYLQPVDLLARDTPTPHPPSVALLVLPLTYLGYTNAVRAWLLIQFAALVLGVYLSLRSVGQRWAARETPPVVMVLLLWQPVDLDLKLGQSTSILLALLAAAQLSLLRQRTVLAGLALGVSLLVKPLAWPWLIVLAWRRMWVGALTAVVVAAVGWSIPALRFGVGPLVTYFSRVLPSMSALYANEVTNLSWWTVGPRLFRGTAGSGTSAPPLVDSPVAASVVGIALPCLVLSLALVWLVLARPQLVSALVVFTVIALIASPISWAYYLGLAVLPAARVARALPLLGWRLVPWLVAAMCVGLLILVQDALIQFARQLSSPEGAAPGELSLLGSLVTLGPGVGTAGLAALVAYCDRLPECVPLSTDSKPGDLVSIRCTKK